MARNRPYPDPARLLERCKRGDEAAWRELVEGFQNLVYSIPSRMKLGPDDCADVFQNTFAALAQGLHRIESGTALPKWLAVTATREALRVKRLAARLLLEGTLSESIASEDESALQTAIRAASAEQVRRAVDKLPARCRTLLRVLFLQEGTSYNEVSERLGIPIGAIGPTRARCLDKLRKILEEAGFFE